VTWKRGEDPRRVLADWVTSTNNPLFAEAMVNRLWKHFLGVGIVEPVDDLRASNPPSNPELMAYLAREFRSSGHDLRHVMRLILNSRTYQLSSASVKANETDRKFYFLSLFGRSERVTACACERKGEVTLPQLLHLQNGAETMRKLADTDGRIRRIARPKRELSEAVGELYVVALGRRPTRAELDAVLPTLEGVAREEALRDLAWALLNSKEFNFNH
jgi:hypothetical protein